MTKLAFVTPWYGADIPGGAEFAARNFVQQLHQAGHVVEVLTTCIKDFYSDWGRNYHKPGKREVGGVTVRQFPVRPRDKRAFDNINWRLMKNQEISAVQQQTFVDEMIRTPALYEYIAEHAQEYLFFFIPYMFATTYHGVDICPERSIVIPCLHDEGYARSGIYDRLLSQSRGLIFLSHAERIFLEDLLGRSEHQIREVVGVGLNTEFEADHTRFRQKFDIETPFVLYVGRREPGKNTPLLLDYWERYVEQRDTEAQLILIGPGEVSIPESIQSRVRDLGYVSTQDKSDALAAANLLCAPSVHESFSLVIMESWTVGTPVLVHGQCAVTKEHCQLSNGGLYFTNFDEFAASVDYMLDRPHVSRKMGEQGRAYVKDNFQWPLIIDKFAKIIERSLS